MNTSRYSQCKYIQVSELKMRGSLLTESVQGNISPHGQGLQFGWKSAFFRRAVLELPSTEQKLAYLGDSVPSTPTHLGLCCTGRPPYQPFYLREVGAIAPWLGLLGQYFWLLIWIDGERCPINMQTVEAGRSGTNSARVMSQRCREARSEGHNSCAV